MTYAPPLHTLTKPEILAWCAERGILVKKSSTKEALLVEARVGFERALRASYERALTTWFMAPITPDVAPPSPNAAERTHGWHVNFLAESVYEAWSTCHSHGRDHDFSWASQGPLHLYSTKGRALLALRRHLARETAEKMLLIDRMIDLRDLLSASSEPKAG